LSAPGKLPNASIGVDANKAANTISKSVGGPRVPNVETTKKRSLNMSDFKDQAKKKIDEAADATKKAAGKVVNRSKDVVHNAGKKIEEGGKRLQSA
jgi:hypothetical protein